MCRHERPDVIRHYMCHYVYFPFRCFCMYISHKTFIDFRKEKSRLGGLLDETVIISVCKYNVTLPFIRDLLNHCHEGLLSF